MQATVLHFYFSLENKFEGVFVREQNSGLIGAHLTEFCFNEYDIPLFHFA